MTRMADVGPTKIQIKWIELSRAVNKREIFMLKSLSVVFRNENNKKKKRNSLDWFNFKDMDAITIAFAIQFKIHFSAYSIPRIQCSMDINKRQKTKTNFLLREKKMNKKSSQKICSDAFNWYIFTSFDHEKQKNASVHDKQTHFIVEAPL